MPVSWAEDDNGGIQSQITLVGPVVHTCEPSTSQAEAEDREFPTSLGCVDHEFTTSLGYMDHEFATSLGCILRPCFN